MTDALEDKIARVSEGMVSSGNGLRGIGTRVWNNILAIAYIGALDEESQIKSIEKINRKRSAKGLKEWKNTHATLMDTWIFGMLGSVEHFAEGLLVENLSSRLEGTPIGFISDQTGVNPAIIFYMWSTFNFGQTVYRIYRASGPDGKPTISYSLKGAVFSLGNYLFRK